MGDCELCGAMKVGTRQVKMGKAMVSGCARCVEKMGLAPKQVAPGLAKAQTSTRNSKPTSGGYGGLGRRGKDIMVRGEKELASDFGKRIMDARKKKGWNQETLGKRMAETVNIIKQTESGKRPTDSVLKKFERVLGITLWVEAKPQETSRVADGPSRGMTLGDYFNQNR